MNESRDAAVSWQPLRVLRLGAESLPGGEGLRLGRRPQIRAAHFEGLGDGLLVGNEIKDLWFISDLFSSQPRTTPLWLRAAVAPYDLAPVGYSGSPFVGDYRYVASWPGGDAKSDLLVSFPLIGKVERWRAAPADRPAVFERGGIVLEQSGLPERIHWQRQGPCDLLMAGEDGRLLRHAHLSGGSAALDPAGVPVCDEAGPLQFTGLAHLCVVDWFGRGRSDLLVGTPEGEVLLLPDIGDETQVRFDRPMQLEGRDGPILLSRGASPAVLRQAGRRHLIVADGVGVLHAWPMDDVMGWTSQSFPSAWTQGRQPITPSPLRSESAKLSPLLPELLIDLPVNGPHEIHVTFAPCPAGSPLPKVEARLSGQPEYRCLSPGETGEDAPQRVLFTTTDLAGHKLHLRQLEATFDYTGGWPTWIDSIQLIPCPMPAKPSAHPAPAMPMAAMLDTFMWFNHIRCDSFDHMDALMACHQQAGFNRMYYKLGGGSWEYPSRIAGAAGAVPNLSHYSPDDKAYCRKLIDMLQRVNRVELAAASCAKRGMAFYGWMRIQNHGEHLGPHARYSVDQFFLDHPHLCEQDIHGRPVPGKLCLAWPQVREYLASLATEAMRMGAQGILIDTLRQLPKVMYGQPILDRFEQEHQLDMRTLSPFDPRVVAAQVRVMTDLLRAVRQAITAVRSDAQLHVRVGTADPLMGCDVGQWARLGLIDAAIIEYRGMENRAPDVAGLAAALRGTACMPIASFARPTWKQENRPMTPHRVLQETRRYLADGARGIAFYETARVITHPSLCEAIRRIATAGLCLP